MAINNTNKTLIIGFLTNWNNSWCSLQNQDSINDISVQSTKNNIVIAINPTFYENNKLYVNSVILEQLLNNVSTIVINNDSLISNVDYAVSTTNNQYVLNLPSTTKFTKEMLNSLNTSKYVRFEFDDDISVETANLLQKHNISFYTSKLYPLLNLEKFSGSSNMLTFSDYYNLGELSVNSTITKRDFKNLTNLFSFNKQLYIITLNGSMKQNLEIVKAYLNNISKYSHSHFYITLNNIILNKQDNEYLYEINKLLTKNKCNLHLVTPSNEKVTYKNYTVTLSPLKKFASKINLLNLSVIEKLILIEDYAKQRPYFDSKDNKSLSRNFFSSLNSDFVVCYTYANTFKVLCDYANIPCTISTSRLSLYNGKVSEHAKVICRVTDAKYKFSGTYIFEPTFDSMQLDSDFEGEKPCDNYVYFANTLDNVVSSRAKDSTEFGLLAYILEDTVTTQDKRECLKQINELYGLNLTLNSNLKTINNAITTAINDINNSFEIGLDIFKCALQTARLSVGEFTQEDLTRIVNINTIKASEELGRFCTNRFVDPSYYNKDEEIITFYDL